MGCYPANVWVGLCRVTPSESRVRSVAQLAGNRGQWISRPHNVGRRNSGPDAETRCRLLWCVPNTICPWVRRSARLRHRVYHAFMHREGLHICSFAARWHFNNAVIVCFSRLST